MAREEEQDRDLDVASGRNGPPIFLILLIIVAVVTAIFIAQNRERTNVEFMIFDFNSRRWTMILIAIVLGILIDRLAIMWWRRARRDR